MIDQNKSSQSSSQSVVWAIVALLFGGAVGYGAGNTHNTDTLNNLNQTVDDYRAKLEGASPLEASDKIAALQAELAKLKGEGQKTLKTAGDKMKKAEADATPTTTTTPSATTSSEPTDPDVYTPPTDASAPTSIVNNAATAEEKPAMPKHTPAKGGRSLSLAQSKTFVDFMHIFAGKTITVTSSASDDEAQAYGDQMVQKLQEAGLNVNDKLGALPESSDGASGVVVSSKELRSAKAIATSLNIEGITATADEAALPARDQNDLTMMIGSNPVRTH